MHEVTIYLADGCHLCESARSARGRQEEIPFRLVEVAIDGDPDLERAYRERIPVVEVDGEEAFTYFVRPGRAPQAPSSVDSRQTGTATATSASLLCPPSWP